MAGEDLPGVGSVAAGGRYDELVGKFSEEGVQVRNILHVYHNVVIPDISVCINHIVLFHVPSDPMCWVQHWI